MKTAMLVLDSRQGETLERIVADLKAEAGRWFESEGIELADRQSTISFDVRYVGQNFELLVQYDDDPHSFNQFDESKLRTAFFHEHERSYGYFNPHDPIEIVNVRLTAIGRHKKPDVPPSRSKVNEPRPFETRAVWFNVDAPTATPVFIRDDLSTGHTLAGPAVIEQFDATTILHPGDHAFIDAALNMHIEVAL